MFQTFGKSDVHDESMCIHIRRARMSPGRGATADSRLVGWFRWQVAVLLFARLWSQLDALDFQLFAAASPVLLGG